MDIKPDGECAERMRSCCEHILKGRGPDEAFTVAVSGIEGEAMFLADRLVPAVAFELVMQAADRILERGAAQLARPPEMDRLFGNPKPDGGMARGGMARPSQAGGRFSKWLPRMLAKGAPAQFRGGRK